MIRNVIGSVLALAGATAAVWSPFRAWYDGRHGSEYRIEDLFGGITDAKADVIGSILLPFVFAAVVTLAGVVFRSRLLVALAGLTVLGFTILWMVRVGQAEGGLTITGDGTGLGDGVANALGGGVLLLLASLVMSGRRAPGSSLHISGPEPARHTEPWQQPTDHPPYGGPVDPDRPTQPGHPVPGDPYGAPTRTMDVPRWDQDRQDPGQQPWDQDPGQGQQPPPGHRG